MLLKNTASQGVYLLAWDTVLNQGKTGDASNITGLYSLDGGSNSGNSFSTTHPTEVGNGLYWQPLAQSETNATKMAYEWTSTTSGILIDPVLEGTQLDLNATAFASILAETGIDIRQAISLILAAECGKLSGAGTTTITIKNANGSTTRILATVDSSSNRTAITLTPS